MRGNQFAYGFFGALIGCVLGIVSSFLLTTELAGGNDLGAAFMLVFLLPFFSVIGAVFGIVLSLCLLRYFMQEDLEGFLKPKQKRLKMALTFGIPVLIIGMPWLAIRRMQPPSDQQLLSNFSQHRHEFDQLVSMAQTDKALIRVDDNWTAPDDPQTIGVSSSRITEYRRLLKNAGTPRGFQTSGSPTDIEFYYYLTGSAISSDTDKGYAYLAASPAHQLKSLDDCQPDEKNGVEAYRHIDGNWYLFYEYLPS